MSKTVDERVVEMRFDNAQFEKNVQTSMSTLDKLKQKLNLSGAAKGFNEIDSAAKKVDMSGLGSGVEAVSAKFSALQVMGVTALANITNSAVNAGKNIVSALTIDPVKTGFQEYETQINAVQTILANTESKGTTLQQVNRALDELNTYADKTIYNFTEMTKNIGTFTAAGVDLDTSVSAIQGIANLAAVSGSTSQQASTAMYQLSQALSSGTVKLMDWNSVVNAGMGGQVFQDALKQTARVHGIAIDEMIEKQGSFRETLQEGWLTSDILTETLNQFTMAAEEGSEEWEAYKKSLMDTGYTEEQAISILKLANTATDAATKVKTFTQLWDTLKEAAQSGWTQSWEIMIGDFEEAKGLLTDISDRIGKMIGDSAEARNSMLSGGLSSGWKQLLDQGIADESGYKETFSKVAEEHGVSIDKMIASEKKLDDSLTDSEAFQKSLTKGLKDGTITSDMFSESVYKLADKMSNMSAEELKAAGYTVDHVKQIKELASCLKDGSISMDEFTKKMMRPSGRENIIQALWNSFDALMDVIAPIKEAFREFFPRMTGEQLYELTEKVRDLTEKFKISEEDVDKLKRTFKGLFAVLDIVSTITGGGLKLAFKGLSAILGAFDMNVLDLTANLGDMLVKFRDFLFNNKLIDKGLKSLASGVKMAVEAFKDFIDSVKDIPKVQEFLENLKNIDLSEIGKNIIDGLKNGLKDGITSIPSILIEIGTALLEAIKGVLGIHSPSTEMYDVGSNAILGLVDGLKDGAGKVWNAISGIGSKMLEWIKNFDWSKAFALGVSVTLLATVKKMVDTLDNITAPLAGVGDVLSGVGEVLSESAGSISKVIKNFAKIEKSFSKVINAKAFQMRAEAIRNLAISLAILAGSVYLLAQIDDHGKLWSSVGAILALSVILGILAVAMDKLSSASASINKEGINFKGLKTGLISIGIALLLLAATVKIVGSMDTDQYTQGFLGLVGLVGTIILVFAAFGQLVKGKSAQNIDKAGKMLRSMAITLLLMVGVCKLAGMLSVDEMKKGAAFAAAFLIFTVALAGISKITERNVDKLASSLLKISLSMALMMGVCKLAGSLSSEEMKKGAAFAAAFLVFIGILVDITRVAPKSQIAQIGGLLLSISIAMGLMVGVCKLVGKLSAEEMLKGAGFAIAFLIFVKAIMSITKIGKKEQIAKVAGTLIAMSVAIGIMAGVCILLGLISLPALAKGVAAVSILGYMLKLMIQATRGANDVKGSIIAMSVAIAVMTVAVAALSFIDPSKLAGSTAALAIIMGMFALMAKASGSLNGAIGSLIVMTVMIGVLAGVIYLLAKLPIESVLGVSASLSVLLLSLSASCAILSKTSAISPMALVAAGVMTLVVAALAGILYSIRGMDPEAAIGNAKALSLLVLALSAACVVLSLASLTTPMALVSVAVMTLVVAKLAEILYSLRDMDPASAIGNAKALSMLLLALSASCVILEVAGLMGPAALAGVVSMIALVAAVGGLMAALGYLTTHFDKLEEFLDKGLPILEKIGYGLGSFFGNVVDGFMTGATSGLPDIANNLTLFAAGLMPLIATVKQIDNSALSGVKSLVEMMAMISGTNFIESIVSKFTGTSSMDAFSTQLSAFGKAIVSFSNTVKGNIDEEAVTAAANAGKVMAEMNKSLPSTGGKLQSFLGEKDMALFAEQMIAFGEAIVSFSETVKGNIDEDAVTSAANAGKIMAELASNLPSTGGFLQKFLGEKDLETFGSRMKAFGDAVVSFSDAVSSGIDEDAVTSAANAGKTMNELVSNLPKSGGSLQDFLGEQNLETFGDQLVEFGKALTEFSQNTNVEESAITTAANAGRMMAELQEAIPDDGWFDDKVSIEDFGKKIKKFGKYLVDYSEEVSGIDPGPIKASIYPARSLVTLCKSLEGFDGEGLDGFNKVKNIGEAIKKYSDKVDGIDAGLVSSSISSAINLKGLINSLSGIKTDGVNNFKVASIGKKMKDYSDSVSGVNVEVVAGSVASAKQLVGLIRSMSGLNISGVSSFKSAIDTLAKTNISGLVKAFSVSTPKVVSIGSNLSNSLTKGFKSGQSSLISAATSMVSSCYLAIRSNYDSFYSSGKYLGEGLVLGIKDKETDAYNAGYKLGKKAVQGEKDGQKSKSPSKLTIQAGKWLGEGLIIGIDKMNRGAYKAGYNLGDTAANSVSSSMSRLASIINDDIDVQPTIRPVVDLSDVRNSAGYINNMFNGDSMIGVTSDVNAIKSYMNNRGQNGANSDVVSAIDKLRKDLGNVGNTYYTIDGITYDDGTNISNAVETLVRAARIERRM